MKSKTQPVELETNRTSKGLEEVVAVLADANNWNWTRMMSERNAADCVLGLMARVGLIKEKDHKLGGKIWTVNGKKFGRLD